MSERSGGESPFSGSDKTELDRVFAYRRRIDDAYESGSGDNVSELILEMKAHCDPNIIALVEAEMRRERQLHRMGPAQ